MTTTTASSQWGAFLADCCALCVELLSFEEIILKAMHLNRHWNKVASCAARFQYCLKRPRKLREIAAAHRITSNRKNGYIQMHRCFLTYAQSLSLVSLDFADWPIQLHRFTCSSLRSITFSSITRAWRPWLPRILQHAPNLTALDLIFKSDSDCLLQLASALPLLPASLTRLYIYDFERLERYNDNYTWLQQPLIDCSAVHLPNLTSLTLNVAWRKWQQLSLLTALFGKTGLRFLEVPVCSLLQVETFDCMIRLSPQLERLEMYGEGLSVEAFVNMRGHVQYLTDLGVNLCSTALQYGQFDAIARFPSLHTLHLDSSAAGFIDPRAAQCLAACKTLRRVLFSCREKWMELHRLSHWLQLTQLHCFELRSDYMGIDNEWQFWHAFQSTDAPQLQRLLLSAPNSDQLRQNEAIWHQQFPLLTDFQLR